MDTPTLSLRQRKDLAAEAMEQADVAALKRLFDEAMDDIQKLVAGMGVLAKHDEKLAYRGNDECTRAMAEVAIEAIRLARDVAVPKQQDARPA